jgi:hypothetical protein
MKKLKVLVVASAATMLSSCDLSQIPGLDGKFSLEDSKAVGAACRHSGRALEDCFAMNPKTYPSGVFEGWRDMNDYMLANSIDIVKPEIRNSSFSPVKDAAHAATLPPVPGSAPKGEQVEAVPLTQGRQRWSPKDINKSDSDLPPAGLDEEKKSMKPTEESADLPPEVNSIKPWERQKDPKKHT